MARYRVPWTWSVVLGGLTLASSRPTSAADKLSVLMLSGQNNHDWRQTTPLIQQILEGSGRFVVDVTEHPELLTADTLRRHDAVVSNWNSFQGAQPPAVTDWPPAARQALADFVAGGKGFVTIHAGGSSFYGDTWPEYHKLAIARWELGHTGHGEQHAFAVRIEDAAHPITAGMPDFFIHDELWHKASVVEGAAVLATAFSARDHGGSGDQEPVMFVRPFGSGRCFTMLLGHGPGALRNPALAALLARGTEWAAAGTVTLPLPRDWPATTAAVAALTMPHEQALAELRAYTFGRDRAPLDAITAWVVAAGDDPQRRREVADALAEVLSGTATADGKRVICGHLGRIGSGAHVHALAALLADPALADAARGALEVLPVSEAGAALRTTLTDSSGTLRIGLIDSLAVRRDAEAVPLIAPLAEVGDADTRAAALAALGRIGGPSAVAILRQVRPDAGDPLLSVWGGALLECADGMRIAGDHGGARALYESLAAAGLPAHLRAAAITGALMCADDPVNPGPWTCLLGADAVARRAALQALRAGGTPVLLAELAGRLPNVPDDQKPAAVALLAERGITAALPAIAKLSGHADAQVRRAALVALGTLGDATSVDVLIERLDAASAEDAKIISESLARLRDAAVNGRLIEHARKTGPERTAMLVKVLAARRAIETEPALLELLAHADGVLADEVVRALGELGGEDACLQLIRLLGQTPRTANGDTIRGAIVQTARRSAADPAQPILSALTTANEALAAELLPTLCVLGGAPALEAVRARTSATNEELRLAAVRTLSSWNDASALSPLLDVARRPGAPRDRTLALRGIARLLPVAPQLSPDERSALFAAAGALADGPEDKKALLGCVSAAPSSATLSWAVQRLDDQDVIHEAALAVLTLCQQLGPAARTDASAAARHLLRVSSDAAARTAALRILARSGELENLARRARADSPDGLEPDHGGREADAVNDGNLDTYWDEEDGKSLYRLRLTFDAPPTIGTLVITGYQQHHAAPHTFTVVCDGREVAAVKDATYTENQLLVSIPATACTVLELAITGYYGPSPGIRELEVYAPLPEEDAIRLTWERSDSAVTLKSGDRPVWTFHYGSADPKPYFHPLALLDGTVLTCDRPEDHPWHHGHWFSWKFINGVNYWEENSATGQSDGRTVVREAKVETAENRSARVELKIEYGPPDRPPVLREDRVITVAAPDAAGGYYLDWTLTFTAVGADALLDRTPLPGEPTGQPWGGYAGLSLRMASDLHDLKAVSPAGDLTQWEDGKHRSRAVAVEYHGNVAGRPVGVAMLDHPDNLNAPSPWYLINADPMRFMNASLLCYQPHTLRAGEALTLRYRVLVHPGHWDAAELQRRYDEFAGPSSTKPRPTPKENK